MKTKEKKSKTKEVKAKTIREAYLMALWSEAVKIKYNYTCAYCGRGESECRLNSHHIFGKRHQATRYNIENGICLCVEHHTFGLMSAHQNPDFILWIIQAIGQEKYDELREKANQVKKWNPMEKIEIAKNLRDYINKNKKENNANK